LAKTKTIENLFNYLAFFSDLLPCLFFLLYFKKTKSNRAIWIVIIYSIYDILTNLGLLYLDHKPSRVFLYSSYTFFEYGLFASILYIFIANKKFRKFIVIISLCFSVFIIAYNLVVKVVGIDSIPIGVEAILILIFSFYYLYEQMQDTRSLFIYSRFSFWIVLAMLLYLAGSFFIYIYASRLATEQVGRYWIFTNVFSILKNIFFTIAIIKLASNKKEKKQEKYNLYPLSN
jgi:hypothetical protein